MKLYHQQVCSVFVLGKGYVRITETLLGHPSFRDARRLTASPVQADMLDDFYAYDEDGTRYVWGRGVSLLTSLTCFPLCLLQGGGGGGVRTLFKSSGRDKEGSGVGDEHVMSKVWLISSSRLFLLLLLLHKAVVWSLQIKASINKIAKLVFYKNKFLTCRSLLIFGQQQEADNRVVVRYKWKCPCLVTQCNYDGCTDCSSCCYFFLLLLLFCS